MSTPLRVRPSGKVHLWEDIPVSIDLDGVLVLASTCKRVYSRNDLTSHYPPLCRRCPHCFPEDRDEQREP